MINSSKALLSKLSTIVWKYLEALKNELQKLRCYSSCSLHLWLQQRLILTDCRCLGGPSLSSLSPDWIFLGTPLRASQNLLFKISRDKLSRTRWQWLPLLHPLSRKLKRRARNYADRHGTRDVILWHCGKCSHSTEFVITLAKGRCSVTAGVWLFDCE